MRRRSVPRNPPRSCVASHHFRSRSHDYLGPRVSRNVVMNRCLGNAKRDVTVSTPRASAPPWPIKNRHVPTGGATLSHQKSSSTNIIKAAQGKGIGPTYGFITSPDVGSRATVGTLQTGYPCAQDLKDQPHSSRLRTR
jgi:hypothetical protein